MRWKGQNTIGCLRLMMSLFPGYQLAGSTLCIKLLTGFSNYIQILFQSTLERFSALQYVRDTSAENTAFYLVRFFLLLILLCIASGIKLDVSIKSIDVMTFCHLALVKNYV